MFNALGDQILNIYVHIKSYTPFYGIYEFSTILTTSVQLQEIAAGPVTLNRKIVPEISALILKPDNASLK